MGYKSRDERRAYYIANRQHILDQQRKRRDALRAAGLCTECGWKKKPGDEHIRCDLCRLRFLVNRDERRVRGTHREYNRVEE